MTVITNIIVQPSGVSVTSVNGETGEVILTTDNISDTSDANKYVTQGQIDKLNGIESGAQVNTINSGDNVSLLTNDAGYIPSSEKGSANGVASLDSSSKIPTSQLPSLSITDTFVVASQAAMLALSTAETGDVAIRTDESKSYILSGNDPSILGDWQELLTPADAVQTVNGQTGTVLLDADDIDDSSTTHKFVTAAQVTAIDNSVQKTGNESIAGDKTFTGNTVLNNTSLSVGSVLTLDGVAGSTVPVLTFEGEPNLGIAYSSGGRNPGSIHLVVNGSGKLSVGDNHLTLTVPLQLPTYTVATAPAAVDGRVIYVSDGDAGSPCLGVASGGSWKRVSLGANISAT